LFERRAGMGRDVQGSEVQTCDPRRRELHEDRGLASMGKFLET